MNPWPQNSQKMALKWSWSSLEAAALGGRRGWGHNFGVLKEALGALKKDFVVFKEDFVGFKGRGVNPQPQNAPGATPEDKRRGWGGKGGGKRG